MRFSIGRYNVEINGLKIRAHFAPPIGFISEKRLEEYRLILNDAWKRIQWCKERRSSTWALLDIEWKPVLDVMKSLKRPLMVKKLLKAYDEAAKVYHDKEADLDTAIKKDEKFLDELSNAVLLSMYALGFEMPEVA